MTTPPIEYAKRGWAVFPLAAHSKQPLKGTRGFHDATTEPVRASQLTRGNVGIATGSASGLLVVDVDPDKGGSDTWDEIASQHVVPETVEACTPRGGRHIYFELPRDVQPPASGANVLGPGVDIRCEGGYVVAPPSTLADGRRWEWEASSDPLEGCVPAAAPRWLLDLLSPKHRQPQAAAPVGQAIPEGERESTLVSMAGSMRRRGMEPDEIEAALTVVNSRRCRPILPDKDVARIARSVGRYAPAPPRHAASEPSSDAVPPPARDQQPLSVPPTTPFRPLGYDRESYHFLPKRTQQIATLTAPSLKTDANLMRLAPIEYWESHYPSKAGIAWREAMADLMESCHKAGPYDPRRVRGRGAWHDRGRSVLHLGDRLLVDGTPVPFHAYEGDYIYERRRALETQIDTQPVTAKDAIRYGQLLDNLHWERPTDALFAAGFAFLAPICGALKWRPHVFITGPRGCGKSYILESIISPVLGPEAFLVEGTTTEAGIRQDMQADALPVIFDEIEVQAKRGDDRRIQGIFELARLASSDSSARVVKGSGGGEAVSYRCRSMFLFGAVNVSIKAAADASRISILHLRKPPAGERGTAHFRDLENQVAALLTDEYLGGLRARAYHMIPVIRQSARTLADALAAELGEQRLGDQVGTLLAGAFAAMQDQVVTAEQAKEIVSTLDLSGARESQEVSDEQACLEEILAHQVRVETDRTAVTRSIGALLLIASRRESDETVMASDADAVLVRHGVRAGIHRWPGCFALANKHRAIRGALGETVWRDDWAEILSRLPGATRHTGVRFGPVRGRAVLLPLTLLLPDERPDA